MKLTLFLSFLLYLAFSSAFAQDQKSHLFFLHNRFLETHELEEEDPRYGKTEYLGIITAFKEAGFEVISEKRQDDVNARTYAKKVVLQIDSLLSKGIAPNQITVVGTSKGGYIAQYVSTLAKNPNLNFVFIGSFRESDVENIPQINFCGNILTIYEETDPYGVSAVKRKEASTLPVTRFREVELNTGLGHGFLFKALNEWIVPSVKWAKQNYELE